MSARQRVLEGLPRWQRVPLDAAGTFTGLAMAALAGARRGKAVHPEGVTYDARLSISGASDAPRASELLSVPAEHRALVRFSRSLGVPRPLPDLLGISIRLPNVYGAGRHQDFLLVTSANLPLLHHVFLPARDVQRRPYSSALPYRAGRDTFIVGVLPDPTSPGGSGATEFERLAAAASSGQLRFELAVARLTGRFHPVGRLEIGSRAADELDALRFNPWNTGGGLELAGALNRLRAYAYPMSQAAWGRTRKAGRGAQRAAERELERLSGN